MQEIFMAKCFILRDTSSNMHTDLDMLPKLKTPRYDCTSTLTGTWEGDKREGKKSNGIVTVNFVVEDRVS